MNEPLISATDTGSVSLDGVRPLDAAAERRRSDALLGLQQRVHELRQARAGLPELLAAMVEALEVQLGDGAVVQALKAGADGGSLRHLAAGRLPAELRVAIDKGLAADGGPSPFASLPGVGRTTAIVSVADDPSWTGLANPARAAGLGAVWATAILSATRGLVGALAIYYCGDGAMNRAQRRDVGFAEFVARIAAVAVERDADVAQREHTEALLRDEVRISETLNAVSSALATERDLEAIVQAVTDGATAVAGAQFGAFFYNTTDAQGETMLLYTLAGASREAFAHFPLPRPTAIFAHTFHGRDVLRFDDVMADPRYGQSAPFHGMPSGHLPVRSYLAMPVVSGSGGGVIGGIFLGHGDPAMFTERHEKLIVGVAAQAAIAIDNARLVSSLRASADRLGLALSAAELGDWSLNTGTAKLTLSKVAARIFGVDPATSLSRGDFFGLIDPDDRARVEQSIGQALEGTGRCDVEYRIHRRDGSLRRVAACGLVHRPGGDAAAEMFGVIQDVTQSRQMEIDLRERAEQLADADRRKDEFLATLAHELRNPLAPLRSSLEILRRPGVRPEVQQQARSIMARQVTQMARLIDELIDISRISSGKVELQKERTALRAIVDSAIEIARPAIDEGFHRLTVDIPHAPVDLLIDRTRTAQVLSNLLNNAAKYTPPHGTIELRAAIEGEVVAISIRDSGIGISPEMLGRIFDMFVQGKRHTTQSQGGLGVGLTLARRLVELHGGSLEARSAGIGSGSEFVVRLPLLAAGPSAEAAPPAVATAVEANSPRRVLVVDDNVDSAESMAMLLQGEGHDVQVAHDGLGALDAVERLMPDVVMLDIGLPGIDGYQVAERIRARHPTRPITLIAATGWGQEKDRDRSRRAGFDHHLVKPLDPDAVLRLIAEVAPARRQKAASTGAPSTEPPDPPTPLSPPIAGQPPSVNAVAGTPAVRRKVLVVDDSPLMLESAVAILESEGYEVRTAVDGVEAIEVVAEWRPGVVLLDVHMPRLNGIETARRLRVDHPAGSLGLLMMSGMTLDAAWVNHARAAGFDDCIDKTADPEIWLESIDRLAVSLQAV